MILHIPTRPAVVEIAAVFGSLGMIVGVIVAHLL